MKVAKKSARKKRERQVRRRAVTKHSPGPEHTAVEQSLVCNCQKVHE